MVGDAIRNSAHAEGRTSSPILVRALLGAMEDLDCKMVEVYSSVGLNRSGGLLFFGADEAKILRRKGGGIDW